VDITNPPLSPHTTRSPTFNVRATVKHVSSPMDIEFTVNGYRETFNFSKKDFRSVIKLQPGNNEVVITASNAAGTATDVANIFYEVQGGSGSGTNPAYPTVDITNPSYDNFKTDQEQFRVRAELRNVYSRNDIELSVNGYEINQFDFRNGALSANVRLVNGRNVVRIGARNQDGYASDEKTIILEEEYYGNPPQVDITKPSVNPYATNRQQVTIEARVYNVDRKQDIRYTVDGYESNNFDFNNGVLYATLNVNAYKTVVNISANNQQGQASDEVTILWEEEEIETINKPVVTITSTSNPTADPFDPTNCKSTIIATILNINDRNDIEMWLNGRAYTGFDFNTSTQVFQATVQLAQGNNLIRVKASNTAGTDEDTSRTEGCDVETEKVLPIVDITEPSRNNEKYQDELVTVKAKVKHVVSKGDITFELNGARLSNFSYNKFTEEVSATVTLREGNNTVLIEAVNRDGKDSDQVNLIYRKIQMARLPVVNIETPKNNTTVTEAGVELIAKILHVDAKSDVDIFLNGRSIKNFSFDQQTKRVKANFNVERGNNTIRVVGNNSSGSDEASINVKYTPIVAKRPRVDITKPSNGVVNSTTVSLIASVDNVDSKQDIEVTLNGSNISAFDFYQGRVTATIKLQMGNNTIKVKASTDGGSDQDQVTVVYEKPRAVLPIVDIRTPRNNSSTKETSIKVTATIKNVNSKQDVKLLINGRAYKNFNFQRGTLTANVKLSIGNNTIKVIGENKDGQDQDQVNIEYRRPKQPPVVKITSPKNNQTFNQTKVNITASISNVTNKRDITMTLNGTKQSFNYRNGILSSSVNLKNGKNTLIIKGSNLDGSDEDRLTMNYKPVILVKKPNVYFTAPAKPGAKASKAKYIIKATVENVTSKGNIILKLNNKKLTKFSFNKRTGELKATVTLNNGKNNLSLEATNVSGKDQATSNVLYQRILQDKPLPKVTITSVSNPTVDPFDPSKAKSTIIAKLENVSSKRDITFLFNNKEISNFSYSKRTGTLQVTLDLKKGTNTFTVKAKNKNGQDQASRNLKWGEDEDTGGVIKSRKGQSNNTGSNSRKSRKG